MSDNLHDPEPEPYEPQIPEQSYDWDYEEERRSPKVMWGRVAALAALVLLAFLLGRLTKSSSGVDQAEVARLRSQVSSLQDDLDEARAAAAAEPSPSTSPSPSPSESTAATGDGTTYTVKAGDTLRGIATKFYGDATLSTVIAEANDITIQTPITVGQELTIPPEP